MLCTREPCLYEPHFFGLLGLFLPSDGFDLVGLVRGDLYCADLPGATVAARFSSRPSSHHFYVRIHGFYWVNFFLFIDTLISFLAGMTGCMEIYELL